MGCRISLNWPSGLGFAGNGQPIFDHIFKFWIFNKSLSTKIMENHENFTYILYEQNISPCEFFLTHKIFKNSINKQSLIIIKSHILYFYLFIYFLLETKKCLTSSLKKIMFDFHITGPYLFIYFYTQEMGYNRSFYTYIRNKYILP